MCFSFIFVNSIHSHKAYCIFKKTGLYSRWRLTNMYYSYNCTYCGRVFYTYNENKETAANTLYDGVKNHLKEYGEDQKEFELHDGREMDTNQIYSEMTGYDEAPSGGYEL